MKKPVLSDHYSNRQPSALRVAQIEFMKRTDRVEAVNVAIGNVSLPMHPAMKRRMHNLRKGPHGKGVVGYTPTVGVPEANKAFLGIIASCGFPVKNLHSQITDGGSQAMELAILGACGRVKGKHRPLMLIDPNYTNYISMAERLGVRMVSIQRELKEDGTFAMPDLSGIERAMRKHRPGAIVVIPYDNPCGQFFDQKTLNRLARLAVKYNLWII
ncbi:MAG: aminotransferase class I/II-fold pyridoxal phosphate-dependent enzyme, partial [Planctomycetota bacterium]